MTAEGEPTRNRNLDQEPATGTLEPSEPGTVGSSVLSRLHRLDSPLLVRLHQAELPLAIVDLRRLVPHLRHISRSAGARRLRARLSPHVDLTILERHLLLSQAFERARERSLVDRRPYF